MGRISYNFVVAANVASVYHILIVRGARIRTGACILEGGGDVARPIRVFAANSWFIGEVR